MYQFGSGSLFAIPTINLDGTPVTIPTPVQFGILQDVTLDFSRTVKELHGQYAWPVAIGAGTGKVTGKAKYGRINGALLNLMFGMTPATGEQRAVIEEAGIIDKVKYQVTVAQSTTWLTDLGVKYTLTGLPFTRVAPAAEAVGKYSVDKGVYQFAVADSEIAVKISYLFTTAAAPGLLYTVSNPLLGESPMFQVVWNGAWKGKEATFTLLSCLASKLGMATKLEDFLIPEFDFAAFADDANNLLKISVPE